MIEDSPPLMVLAAVVAVVFGLGLRAVFTFAWTPVHYIHLMLVTLIACLRVGLAVNRAVFGRHAELGTFGRA
ncbi:hypothetical protein [Phenylobacterium sp.]|jgi:SSS family solute:Na+ symporter|uniref:hypothetical protein n=1 Tax=Phenylobacterium sp. TaxID=1871053 RepID=UPI0025D9AE55|nr:hypothetical protein [Phenylobacterium sp.]MCA3721230.1 hypothetical protein [Phenylobacterium sp.]